MRVKINKFLAVLVCVAIMISVATPIMAMTYADDCCDNHDDVHDCSDHGSVAPEPKNEPKPEPEPEPKKDTVDNEDTGSGEQGGGSTDSTPAEENKPDSGDCDGCCDTENDCIDCEGDPCICADDACEDCDCETCDCIDCEGNCENTIAAIVESLVAGLLEIAESAAFMPFSAGTGTVIYSMINDTGLATTTGIGNSVVLGQAGSPTITVSGDQGFWVITATNRTVNWHGVDIKLSGLTFKTGYEYEFVITGTTTPGKPVILGQTESPWGWIINTTSDSSGNFSLTRKLSYNEMKAQTDANQNFRLALQDELDDYVIQNITITEIFSGNGLFNANGTLRAAFELQNSTIDIIGDVPHVRIDSTTQWHGLNIFRSGITEGTTIAITYSVTGTAAGGGSWGPRMDVNYNDAGAAILEQDITSGQTLATATATVTAASLTGRDFRIVRNGDAGNWQGLTLIIHNVVITPPSGTVTPAPIFEPKPGGDGLQLGMFNNWNNHALQSGAIGGLTNSVRFTHNTVNAWDWGARISFANLGITEPANYTIAFTYFVPSATRGTMTQLTFGANDGVNFDNVGITNFVGERWPQITVDAWTTHSFSFTANTTDSNWDATRTLRIQPNGGGFTANQPWYISSIKVTKNYDLCSNLANHAGLPAATCTANAVACTVCGHQNAPVASYNGHTFAPYTNTQHRCTRTVNGAVCGALANHSTTTVGQSCSVCNHTIQAHECIWGTPVITGVTCSSDGVSTRTCTVAGCTNTTTAVAPGGHDVVNGACTRCNLTPCGMCGTVGDWRWGGNEGSHWSSLSCCDDFAPHFYNANGLCICGRTGTPSVTSPCGMCGTVGVWRWGGNEGSHWSSATCCEDYEPHSYNAQGVCKCGATGTPTAAPSACGMCGAIVSWSWGGNADVHWADGCSCLSLPVNSRNAPHTFNAQGVCSICGATRESVANATSGTPCAMCGVIGDWAWGGNTETHWAVNCNCTANEPHSFGANGRCRCGASSPTGVITAPQEAFREEDFIDASSLIDDLRRAIDAGEVPTIDLAESGSVTIISADVFQAIKESGVDVVVILPSGYTFTIIASSISEDVGAFDLNIEVLIKHEDVQLETIGGGKVDISKNSLVFRPNFHGEFGFELVFHVTAEQLDEAGIDRETVSHFHVCGAGNVTEKGGPKHNDDGSLHFSFDHASFHVLSSTAPITAEVGTNLIGSDAVEGTDPGEEQVTRTIAEIQESMERHASNLVWIVVAISVAAALAAASVTVVMLRRRSKAKGTR